MTPQDVERMLAEATPEPMTMIYAGSGERLEPAIIALPGEYGDYHVTVDHRRDYTDPAPDARRIVLQHNLMPLLVELWKAADVLERNIAGIELKMLGEATLDRLINLGETLGNLKRFQP